MHFAGFCRSVLLASVLAGICLPATSSAQDSGKFALLTLEQAREVMKKKPAIVSSLEGAFGSFDSLTNLTPGVAEVLVNHEGALSFNGLAEISPETAAVLARHRPVKQFGYADLRLNGLKNIDPKAAEYFAAHQGKVLMYGLAKLDSIPLAQKLARQWGELRLGIKDLSPQIAGELAKHRGTDEDKTRPGVVSRRQDGAASVLRLDEIAVLSPESAEALADHEGVLVLNGLVSLPPAVAISLAKRTGNSKTRRTGTLVLNGLTSISPESSAALAAFPGELVLKGITELTADIAAVLAKHKGRLHLTGLTKLSPEAAAALQAHPNLLLPRSLPDNGVLPQRKP